MKHAEETEGNREFKYAAALDTFICCKSELAYKYIVVIPAECSCCGFHEVTTFHRHFTNLQGASMRYRGTTQVI